MTVKPKYLVLLLFISLGGIAPSHAANAPIDPKVLHAINRLSFGPRPGDLQRVESMGVERYIQEQLSPNSIPESPSLSNQLSQLKTLQLTPVELLNEYGKNLPPGQKPTPEQRQAAQKRARQVFDEAVQARLLQATTSPRQLQEVMVDFWYNHFNVYANKERDRLLVGAYEQQAIRPYALGRFRDLLGATARHPAMLLYLDNWQNTAPGSPGARGRFQGLNENYARELMELHTLGVDGGYTQQDVIALARIFTGWGFSRPNQQNDSSGFFFDPKRHDFSDKVFLKQTIKGSGLAEGEQALDILARSPATARHISYKLAQYFVSDNPPSALVDYLTERFLSTNGDIRAVLNTLFYSKEFWDSKNFNAKFKTPYEYAISAVRATGSEVKNTKPIFNILQQLGMPLYGYQTPEGYKNTQQAWLNPEAMNRRISFATAIASGSFRLSLIPMNQNKNDQIRPRQFVDALQLANTLGNSFSPQTQSAIASSPPQLQSALILGSPEFMRR
ncbi:DUF1800 domain-containing protein [Nostocaceae cyanobacterium CENA369]|uniref:DUF1800 domain-containing protein n=1 Tax=Dendronalium phyllosphericum CENA369 TaxID=1725256 RepID=A0A8J7LKQ2_9NOST|nr:DUF1800 domain-containing protein [Dendronalium phyllosphericum]MBH8576204.1 DUF1800 domain-containing protein [Dendronalium phyllosphericum CENA369]